MVKRKKIFLIVIAVVLALVLAVYGYVDGMLSKINYSDGTSTLSAGPTSTDDQTFEALDTEPDVQDSLPEEISEAERRITEYLQENSSEITYDENVLNVLLIGCDSRSNENTGRSDSMILVSINKKTEKIVLTSIMRDIYTSIPGYGNNRLNAAFAYGGASLLMDTIEESFQIEVSKFVGINFYSFIDVVETLGGVTISVSEEELPVLNSYVREINRLEGLPSDNGLLQQGGEDLLLTGKQALGYCRIRYVGNADYERTERQRKVLTQIFEKAKSLNMIELNDLLTILLPNVTTNLDKSELYALLLSAPALSQYELEEDRIPIDGSYRGLIIRKMSVLSIDFQINAEEMHQRIYGE